MKKKTLLVLIAIFMVFSLSACSLLGGGGTDKVTQVAGYERTDGLVDYTTRSDGRKVDGHQIAFLNDDITTAWFKFKVNSVEFVNEYEGVKASSGNVLAVVNITVKNTYDGGLDMYYNDFWLAWDLDADSLSYADEIGMYQNGKDLGTMYTVSKNKTFEADYVFELPKDTKSPYMVEFYEYYTDGVYGNDFFIIFE